MISLSFQGKPFNITVIQAYALTSNVEEVEVEWCYEDLQVLLELSPKKKKKVVLFIIGGWRENVGSQETAGVTANLALDFKMSRAKSFVKRTHCALVIANTLFRQHKTRLHLDINRQSIPKSD